MAMGVLCEPLCSEHSIHSLACESLHSGKEAVFSANWETTRLIFKAARYYLLDKEQFFLFQFCYKVKAPGT